MRRLMTSGAYGSLMTCETLGHCLLLRDKSDVNGLQSMHCANEIFPTRTLVWYTPPATPMNMAASHLIFRFLRTCGRSKKMAAFSLLVLVSKYSHVLRSDLLFIVLILA